MSERAPIPYTKRLVNTSCMLTPAQLEGLHQLLRLRRYPSRSEAIRTAVRDLLNRELLGISLEHEEFRKYTLELYEKDPQVKEVVEDLVIEICGREFTRLKKELLEELP